MPLGTIFWMLMILWFIFGLWWNWPRAPESTLRPLAVHLLSFVLFFIVGWRLFGFVVQG